MSINIEAKILLSIYIEAEVLVIFIQTGTYWICGMNLDFPHEYDFDCLHLSIALLGSVHTVDQVDEGSLL